MSYQAPGLRLGAALTALGLLLAILLAFVGRPFGPRNPSEAV